MRPLSQDQVKQYNRDGFLLVKKFIAPEIIQRIRTEARDLSSILAKRTGLEGIDITWEKLPEGEPPLIRQLMGSQNISAVIRELTQSCKMTGAMEQLLGAEVELFHSKLMMKPAMKGSFTPWHSDWGYWKELFRTPTQMNAFLAIDESTLENGCIRYVPGSHLEYIEHIEGDAAHGFGVGLPGDIDAFDAVPIEMEPGDVTFHGSITIHASEGNRSPSSRIMNTFAYTTKNCLLDTDFAREEFARQSLRNVPLLDLG